MKEEEVCHRPAKRVPGFPLDSFTTARQPTSCNVKYRSNVRRSHSLAYTLIELDWSTFTRTATIYDVRVQTHANDTKCTGLGRIELLRRYPTYRTPAGEVCFCLRWNCHCSKIDNSHLPAFGSSCNFTCTVRVDLHLQRYALIFFCNLYADHQRAKCVFACVDITTETKLQVTRYS
jgi:hypothetical protein